MGIVSETIPMFAKHIVDMLFGNVVISMFSHELHNVAGDHKRFAKVEDHDLISGESLGWSMYSFWVAV